MALSQDIALVMVNKCMKFHKIFLNTFKVIAKVKVYHHDVYTDNTRVMTIPHLFFSE